MYRYECPQCNEQMNLVMINGQLEGVCKYCDLEVSIVREDWEEWMKENKLSLVRG